MNEARRQILGNIRKRSAVPANREEHYRKIDRAYLCAGQLDAESKLALFEERLRDYDAVVHRCSRATVRSTIEDALRQRGKRQILIAEGFESQLLPDSIEFIRDRGFPYEELDRSEGVLTTCTAAIALSGTIILRHSKTTGRRALTLIPDYHLCLVYAHQVVETVAEGVRALETPSEPVTTISGPSATSDIEMTRIKGVHGPRTLDVIVVVD